MKKQTHIFADHLEANVLAQFESAMRQPFSVRGALMPDAHLGYALPIGGVIATRQVVVPAWVGYDIGCGMCALPTRYALAEVREKSRLLFREIYERIPVGFEHNRDDTDWDYEALPRSTTMDQIFRRNGLKQLGSLGGGNHFIEVGHDEQERVWVIIHSGSRGIGHACATHYMKLASHSDKAREGHYGFDTGSREGRAYIQDQRFCAAFALENRLEMMRRVLIALSSYCSGEGDWPALINRHHNHVEEKDGLWIHRKGATHAEAGMLGVVPGNMRDGSFIVRGLGNPDALWSSSHGAGRTLGRREAKRQLSMQQFQTSMEGITARISKATLDEAPLAYKDIFEVMRQQASMVEVLHHIRPVLNIKG